MTLLQSALFYLAVHFAVYLLTLREWRLFRREKAIFLYHAGSFLLWAFILWLAPAPDVTRSVGILSLHGIYSLSFLELWALSRGGYSLRILDAALDAGVCTAERFEPMKLLGAAKTRERLNTLLQWRLVKSEGDRFKLTPFGRFSARFLRLLAWPSGGVK